MYSTTVYRTKPGRLSERVVTLESAGSPFSHAPAPLQVVNENKAPAIWRNFTDYCYRNKTTAATQ